MTDGLLILRVLGLTGDALTAARGEHGEPEYAQRAATHLIEADARRVACLSWTIAV